MDRNNNENMYQNGMYSYTQQNNAGTFKRKSRKNSLFKKIIALTLSASLFGGVAGGAFYGVNRILENSNLYEAEQSDADNWTATPVSYMSGSESINQNMDVSDIAALGLPSVVSVTNISVQEVNNYFGRFGRNSRGPVQTEETVSCGSGIIIYQSSSELYMVTNYHVVESATTLSVTFVDDETYEARLCGYDEENDLAVIKVSVADLSDDTISQISVVAIGDSDELTVGEQVVAIGNALGYGQSITTGVVSAVNRTISGDSSSATYIQTDAAINPGNSGGALLNMDGELIGINTAKLSSTEVEGMGYAIPISRVIELIGNLME